jgi:hypothetical protein
MAMSTIPTAANAKNQRAQITTSKARRQSITNHAIARISFMVMSQTKDIVSSSKGASLFEEPIPPAKSEAPDVVCYKDRDGRRRGIENGATTETLTKSPGNAIRRLVTIIYMIVVNAAVVVMPAHTKNPVNLVDRIVKVIESPFLPFCFVAAPEVNPIRQISRRASVGIKSKIATNVQKTQKHTGDQYSLFQRHIATI